MERKGVAADGILKSVSPSQIDTFLACKMKWAFDKIAGVPRAPDTAAITLGKNSHKMIEDWANGIKDDRSELILKNHHLLKEYEEQMPGKGGKIKVEFPVDQVGLSLAGIPVNGFIDMHVPPPNPINIDHKFRGSLKYAKAQDDLEMDSQAIIYSAATFKKYPEETVVQFAHNNYQTKGAKKSLQVLVTFSRKEIEAKMEALAGVVEDMKETAKMELEQIPGNLAACNNYGGCEYFGICEARKQGIPQLTVNMEKAMAASNNTPVAIRDVEPPQAVVQALPTKEMSLLMAYNAVKVEVLKLPKENITALSASMREMRDAVLATKKARLFKNVMIHGDANTQDLCKLIRDTREEMSKKLGVLDISMVPSNHPEKELYTYGNWKITLLKEVIPKIDTTRDAYIRSQGGTYDFAMDTIHSIYETIIEGNMP